MGGFLVRRLLALVPLLLVVSIVVFSMVHLIPGDAARRLAGDDASEEQVEALRQQLGLDDPLPVQYGRWLSRAARLDFGDSLFSSRAVSDELKRRLPVTFSLIVGAVLVALLVGVPAGIGAGIRQGGWLDRVVTTGASAGIAIPSFWLALMLVVVFAVELRWLPARGYAGPTESLGSWARHLVLPAISLGVLMAATLARQLRGALGDVMQTDYIRTARAKGLAPWRVIGKHALKNAAMPAITVLGLQIGYLFGGAVIVEQIYALPGVGTSMVHAILRQDIPVIQGGVMVMAVLVVATNLLVDLVYGYVNPKVRVA